MALHTANYTCMYIFITVTYLHNICLYVGSCDVLSGSVRTLLYAYRTHTSTLSTYTCYACTEFVFCVCFLNVHGLSAVLAAPLKFPQNDTVAHVIDFFSRALRVRPVQGRLLFQR